MMKISGPRGAYMQRDYPKYKMARSSMFNRNPMFERTAHVNDNTSEYSVGHKSQANRRSQVEPMLNTRQVDGSKEGISPRGLVNFRSLSSRKLNPITTLQGQKDN